MRKFIPCVLGGREPPVQTGEDILVASCRQRLRRKGRWIGAPRMMAFRPGRRTGKLAGAEVAMNQNAFADALDAVEQLDVDAQVELVALLSRRLAERGRERVAATVAQARREFAAGQCQPMTAAELVREAQT
jgi:hypothetical protein